MGTSKSQRETVRSEKKVKRTPRTSKSMDQSLKREEGTADRSAFTRGAIRMLREGVLKNRGEVLLAMVKFEKAISYKTQLVEGLIGMLREKRDRIDGNLNSDNEEENLRVELTAIDRYLYSARCAIQSKMSLVFGRRKSVTLPIRTKCENHATRLVELALEEVGREDCGFRELIESMAAVLCHIQLSDGAVGGYSTQKIYMLDKAVGKVASKITDSNSERYFNEVVKPIYEKLVQILLRTEEANV